MSEFNLFMGTARRSIGDVTLMRKNGRQVARVRLHTIKNPKTEAQAIQRNFVAPVARFYGPLRTVLERSFEGLSKDASYNKFQSVNIDLARKEQWYQVKGSPWSPFPYQLSRGTLKPVSYDLVGTATSVDIIFQYTSDLSEVTTVGHISQCFMEFGYLVGDIVTILIVKQASDGSYRPIPFQFAINPDSVQAQTTIFGGECQFDVDGRMPLIEKIGDPIVAASVIISRYYKGQWLRSTQYLSCASGIVSALISQEAKDAAIASYQAPGSDDGGGVYPGGDDNLYNVSAADGRALLFVGGQYTAQIVEVDGTCFIVVKPDNYDQFYGVRNASGQYLYNAYVGGVAPASWRTTESLPSGDMEIHYIQYTEGDSMYRWLISIGCLATSL